MDWYFDFITCHRRELHDYEQTVTVEDQDSLDKALIEAVSKLPLGERDNPYSRLGVEWELLRITPMNSPEFTNDKEGD
jgi:2-methylcitrate dehydratase PrpD